MDMLQILVVAAGAAVLIGAGYLFGWLKTKGIDAGAAIGDAGVLLGAAYSAMEALGPLMPDDSAGKVNWVLGLARCTVQAAEQLYKAGTIESGERKAAAERFICSALTVAGIEMTPDLQVVIDGAVECAVALLPKTHDGSGEIAS